jgi:short-subunit dehydrogenase
MNTANRPRPVAVVTGASTGIGKDLADVCAGDGNDVVLVARRGDVLKAVARDLETRHQVTVHTIVEDLTDSKAPGRIVAQLSSLELEPEILVNNAGSGAYGRFLETDATEELNSIQLNVAALTHLTKLILPGMVRRGHGRILNVASTAAFQPGPLMAVYYATKAYVLHLSEALASELSKTGVTVTCLCPGPTRTEFHERAGMSNMWLLSKPMMARSQDVARAGYLGMKRGKRVVIPGLINKLLAFSVRLAPRRWPPAIAGKLQERRGRQAGS